ncbi:hypothetical protein WN48_05881 [Eufriesea mexicana]|uniref:Aromatic amino acid beta-eliminating lyase/threonine aldolase domain-containing protein n=1 Tax=Eufriesea mexicana TaxID=516756 RepID=A0A310SMB6_9HYME|nr:hypothetical protein WN48_05881 [Eufriesea mexicana]
MYCQENFSNSAYDQKKEMIIDLRSDTLTKPTKEMREAMFNADVGDDVFNEDPTVKKLQEAAAEMVGMESAIFVSSGTMGNLIASRISIEDTCLSKETVMFSYILSTLNSQYDMTPNTYKLINIQSISEIEIRANSKIKFIKEQKILLFLQHKEINNMKHLQFYKIWLG